MKRVLIPILELAKVRLAQRISLPMVSLSFSRESTKRKPKPALVLENGFGFLLENGGRILIEKEGSKAYPPVTKKAPVMCLETGGGLLLESGGSFQLETNNQQ